MHFPFTEGIKLCSTKRLPQRIETWRREHFILEPLCRADSLFGAHEEVNGACVWQGTQDLIEDHFTYKA